MTKWPSTSEIKLTKTTQIIEVLNAIDLSFSLEQVERLCKYVEMLIKWNKTYNLTSLKDEEAILKQHIFDSLAAVPSIKEHIAKYKIKSAVILDVGTGAGLPGIILAIMMPGCSVTCIDAVEKKIAFIKAVRGQLNIDNLNAQHARIEQADPVNADIVISRAFASISDFVELAQHHVAPLGVMIAMKAKQVMAEISHAATNHPIWRAVKTESLVVPKNNAQRCLVWLQKEQQF